MSQILGGWIHSFTVTDTITHKKGFTVYKITSIVFPRSVPEALTCITVWKRFHDVKRLYREIFKRHKNLQLRGQVPEPKDFSFFKRFEPDVIQNRKDYIIQLLDFVAQHPALYKSHPFMQFFENGHTPNTSPLHLNKEKGNIEEICDNLDLPFDEDINLVDPMKDDESQFLVDSFVREISEKALGLPNEDKKKDFTKMLTPMASFESEDIDYIYEAALEFSKAVQAEVNLEYREAYEKYKSGVGTLLTGSKDDTNDERKFIAKGKVSKYMARAEDIYEKFLLNSDDEKRKHFQLSIDMTDNAANSPTAAYLERPWNHLSKFKVLRVLEKVMQVQNVTDKSVYIMKGIEKPSSNSPAQSVFLPQGVPYMVDLIAFFQSDEKIFLLLRQAKGGKLFDYVKKYTPTCHTSATIKDIFTEVDPDGGEDAIIVHESGVVELISEHCAEQATEVAEEELVIPSGDMDISDLVSCSQRLLQSVSKTLNDFKEVDKSAELDKESKNMDNLEVPCMKVKIPLTPKRKYSLPEASVKQWARELLVAIENLHLKGVILGDLRTDNLLFGSKGQLLLSYFYQNEGLETTISTSPDILAFNGHFIAPERPLTIKSDWWSFGVVLFELLTGTSLKSCHPGSLDLYQDIQYPNVEISENAKDLLDRVLQRKSDLRLDLDGIKAHPFFHGTKWEEIAKNGLNSY